MYLLGGNNMELSYLKTSGRIVVASVGYQNRRQRRRSLDMGCFSGQQQIENSLNLIVDLS